MKLNFPKFFRGDKSSTVSSSDGKEVIKRTSPAGKDEKKEKIIGNEEVERDDEEEEDEEEEDGDVFVVFEHERWRNDLGWSSRNLEVGDPKRYVSKLHQSDTTKEAQLPTGWQYLGNW